MLCFIRGKSGVYAWDLPARPNPASVDVPPYRGLLMRAAREVLEPFGWSGEICG